MYSTTPKIIIANWKMHGISPVITNFAHQLKLHIATHPPLATIVICPPFTLISEMGKYFADIGAQDCHHGTVPEGAFTGDISASMLKSLDCKYVIIGHSERRTYHHESNHIVQSKAKAAINAGLIAILCVGESLEEYKSGTSNAAIRTQIIESLPNNANVHNIIIAYEPLWAIGTGETASINEISAVHDFIIMLLKEIILGADPIKIIYGGSVKGNNAASILALPSVSGLLVGGASLVLEEFINIINAGN